jgi:hypothetical protein
MVARWSQDHHPLAKLVVSYDIACKLKRHFKADQRLKFAIPAFHAYAHNVECQLTTGIRSVEGAGLTDGEAVERLWAELRPMVKATKVMTLKNREFTINYVVGSRNISLIMHFSKQNFECLQFDLFTVILFTLLINFILQANGSRTAGAWLTAQSVRLHQWLPSMTQKMQLCRS